MITLAIETSTPRGGVALFRDDALLFSESFTADRSHSSELFVVIERALAGDVRPGQIVVGLGPGSYAGVRIAIAAAIGLSIATGAQLLGVPSIAALDEGEYLALGDARCGGYSCTHVRAGELQSPPAILTREEIEQLLSATPLPLFSSEQLPFPGIEIRFPQVDRLARLALAGKSVHARGRLEPLYLREPHITGEEIRNSKSEIRSA